MSIANITKRTICNSLALPCNRKHSERFNILIQNRSINYSQKDYWCLWRDLECFMSRCSTTPSTTEDWKKIAQEFLEFRLFFSGVSSSNLFISSWRRSFSIFSCQKSSLLFSYTLDERLYSIKRKTGYTFCKMFGKTGKEELTTYHVKVI